MFGLCVVIALLGAFVGGASAAFCPEGYMGTVVGKDARNNTFEIQTTHNWSYNWSHIGWQPNDAVLEWLFPNEDAANELCVGDYVEILGFAAAPGWAIGLGKMNSNTELFIADIYGDPNFLEPYWSSEPLDPPLLGNFTIKYNSTPNCSNCGMCNCEANYTNVTIINGTGQVEVDDHQLYPEQTCMYNGIEYRINITFYSGEASACPVCNDICPPGPQPVSNFAIHIETVNQPPETPRGDLNHDGGITPADAVIALRIAVSGEFVEEADIDKNGCVNALDACMILQAAARNLEI
uniref:Dockerin domain-containing protein n=1 Tax=Candidatus Methanogaster sp. ANME-2c ERB4 TaxID=2759911 RepID=A0A7G9YFX4_9EURY|nr:hypothetical protein GBMLOPDG_00004 [Methanosarcinales archaeon ANME-2c ERB4]